MADGWFGIKKEKFGFSERPTRYGITGNSSIYEGGMGRMVMEPSETLEAEKGYITWVAVMACVQFW